MFVSWLVVPLGRARENEAQISATSRDNFLKKNRIGFS